MTIAAHEAMPLVSKARVGPVELSQQGRPRKVFSDRRHPAALRQRCVLLDHGRRGLMRRAAQRERPNLHRACPLEKINPKEGLGDRSADGQRTVIAKQHDVFAT
jgi:hypothetical protein